MLIYIYKVFLTIVFIFIVISTMFQYVLWPFQVFVELGEPSRNFKLCPLLKPRKPLKKKNLNMSTSKKSYIIVVILAKVRTISLSSSSYRAGSTDIPDTLSPLLPIVHRPR